jgi:hypothetical protein
VNPKLLIATPAFGGNVTIPYLVSFGATVALLPQKGVSIQPLVVKSGSLLVAERNRLLEAFWESDCTHMLCIDADVGWHAEDLLRMLHADKEFIAACYPARADENVFLFRPIVREDGSIENSGHLLKMEYIPAGFMLISREAVRKMREAHPDLAYCPKQDTGLRPLGGYAFFNTGIMDGEFWGEDYLFCKHAREAGVDIWVDPTMVIHHAGKEAALIEVLSDKDGQPFKNPQADRSVVRLAGEAA